MELPINDNDFGVGAAILSLGGDAAVGSKAECDILRRRHQRV